MPWGQCQTARRELGRFRYQTWDETGGYYRQREGELSVDIRVIGGFHHVGGFFLRVDSDQDVI